MTRWRRWLVPAVLAVGAVGATATVWALERTVPAPPPGDRSTSLLTPILSVRRVPAVLTAPVAAARLAAELDALVPALPADSCLLVEGPDLRYAHRADAAVVPASTAKLLTATAALEAGRADLVEPMLRESDNRAADRLVEHLGGDATAIPARLDDGSIDLAGVEMVDGSGLSRDNRVTCQALVDVLQRPVTGPVVEDSLSVAGESGTLAERFVGTPLDGTLRAKTGSLRSVAALAGVVADGDPALTFALVVNASPPAGVPANVAGVQLRIGEALAAWPRVPSPAVLGPVTDDG